MSVALLLAVLAAYLSSLPPSLAPWRDTGELCTAVATLGVPHPTSYPLYVLLGRLAQALPLGTLAYRLNLLSAIAGASACAGLFALLRPRRGAIAALAAAAALAFNPTFWAVSQVSEMYSLWVLGALGLVALAERLAADPSERLWPGFCFAAGLLLANRLDLVLLAPGLLWLALSWRPRAPGEEGLWAGLALLVAPALCALSSSNLPAALLIAVTALARGRGEGAARRLAWGTGAALLGLSVYLYLPIRSACGPFLDWNHPAGLSNFLDSLLRTRYGGTLDLVSRGYGVGAMFADNLRLWGAHLWDAFGPLLALALLGATADLRAERGRGLGRFAAWWWAGPVFLFLANMPPNPHAAAIVEPHYLLSDVLLLFWVADGVACLTAHASPMAWLAALAAPVLALAWPLARGVPARLDRRSHFSAVDFAADVLRAAPPGATVVAKKDVQLYALWHRQSVEGRRPDLRVVSQGLSGASWYQAGWRRRDPGLPLSRLAEPAAWAALAAGGAAVLASHDAEPPGAVAEIARSRGLLRAVSGAAPETEALAELMLRRGPRRAEQSPDFFTRDLIEGRALADYRAAAHLDRAGRPADAERALLRAWAASWSFPEVPLYLGFLQARQGRMAEAAVTYALADRLFAEKLELAARYRAVPELAAVVRRQAAEAATHHGVAREKLGDRAGAEQCYRRALALSPLAQTRYNLAVLAWGRDWAAAEENLSEALRLDPAHAEARRYLEALRRRR